MSEGRSSYNPLFVTATASLIQDLDKNVMVLLRDGKSYIGILRSVDSFGSCVLENAFERIYVKNKYGEIPCGVVILRGENIAIIGEINDSCENNIKMSKVSLERILELQKDEATKLIEEKSNWKKYGIHVDKSLFNWFNPFSFMDEDT